MPFSLTILDINGDCCGYTPINLLVDEPTLTLIFDDLAFSIFSLDIYKASSKSVTGDFI